MNHPPYDILTAAQVGELLQVSARTVQRLAQIPRAVGGRPLTARAELQGKILAHFGDAPFTASEVRAVLGAGPSEVKRALEDLQAQGRAELTAETKTVGGGQRARVWRLL